MGPALAEPGQVCAGEAGSLIERNGRLGQGPRYWGQSLQWCRLDVRGKGHRWRRARARQGRHGAGGGWLVTRQLKCCRAFHADASGWFGCIIEKAAAMGSLSGVHGSSCAAGRGMRMALAQLRFINVNESPIMFFDMVIFEGNKACNTIRVHKVQLVVSGDDPCTHILAFGKRGDLEGTTPSPVGFLAVHRGLKVKLLGTPRASGWPWMRQASWKC
eukprot:s719_g6.t1